MALFPMHYGGYWAKGSYEIDAQVVITSKGKIHIDSYYVSYAPLPGIY